jgi:hypothetical protein
MTSVQAETLTIITWNASVLPTANARILSKYLQKYMPEIKNVEVKVVPGAGGISAANHLYNVAKQDGWTIGIIPRSAAIRSILGEPNVNFNTSKFTWLGSTSDGRKDTMLMISRKSYEDGLIVGDTNSGESSIVDFINQTTNLKFRKIVGYKDQQEIKFSYERKEIDSLMRSLSWHTNMPVEGITLLQYGNGKIRNDRYTDTPTLMELAKNRESVSMIASLELSGIITRPFLAPPDISENMKEKLRAAFTSSVKDPEYVKEAERIGLIIDLVDWKQTEDIMRKLSSIDKDMLRKVLD